MIYKKIDKISAEDIISTLEFRDIPDFGDLFTMDKFIEDTDNMAFIDYDGHGDLVIDDKIVCSSNSWIFFKSFKIGDNFIISFKELKNIFGERVKVMWFNK